MRVVCITYYIFVLGDIILTQYVCKTISTFKTCEITINFTTKIKTTNYLFISYDNANGVFY